MLRLLAAAAAWVLPRLTPCFSGRSPSRLAPQPGCRVRAAALSLVAFVSGSGDLRHLDPTHQYREGCYPQVSRRQWASC